MSTSDQSYKQYSFAEHKEVYQKLETAFAKFNAHYYLIGANARDVQLYKAGQKPNRGTADIDFAVMIPSMVKYAELKAYLATLGFEDAYGKEPYRIYHPATNTVIDLLPYGECAQNNTVQFTERSVELSIIGFQEVGEQTESFEHPEGITIPVSPAHGIVILKLISWSEKPERTKDLKDIKALLDSAWELYQDEVFVENSVHSDLLDVEPFDRHITAARIMGRKMQGIVNQSTQLKNEIYAALNKDTEQVSKLSVQMAVETRTTAEKIGEIIEAISLGLEDVVNDKLTVNMPQNWKTYKLEDLAEKVTVGFVGSMAQEYIDDGVPMLRSQNIKAFYLDYSNMKYISNEFHKKINKSSLVENDVAIIRTGNPGVAAVIPKGQGSLNCSDLVIVTPNLQKINPHFLCFYFNSVASGYVSSQLVGAVQQHFNVGSAKKMEIELPTLKEQNEIVDVLKCIIDKIELNLQQNQTLEEMAMALYKHWFVDFGPFQDGEFVESELGRIPEGWEVKMIGDVIETIGGGTPRTNVPEYWEDGLIPWYSPTDLTSSNSLFSLGSAKTITELGLQKSSSRLFPKGSLLMSSRATIGALTISRTEACTNQGFITMIPNEILPVEYLHSWTVHNMDLIISKANGSTFKEISKTNFRNLPILINNEVAKFQLKVEGLYSRIENNLIQNQTLTSLRDTLLPKLISGEMRVKDIESIVKAL